MKNFWKKYKEIAWKSVAGLIFCIILAGVGITAFDRLKILEETIVSEAAGNETVDNYKQVAISTGGAITAYIDWEQQDLKLVSTLGDEYFYISDAKMKTWDEVTAEKGTAYCDLSWITKETTLNIKGDKDPSQTISIQMAAPRTLKAKFVLENGTPQITLTMTETVDKKKTTTDINLTNGNTSVQWRKGTVGNWESYSTLNLQRFMTKGATLNFRLIGEYNSDTTKCYMPSKVAAVKVTKKSSAPSIKIDGSKLILGVKKGQEYTIITSTTTGSIYSVTDKSEASPLLSEVANKELGGDGYITPLKAFSVKVRTAATAKKAASKWTVISYPAQEEPLNTALTVNLPATGTGATIINNTAYDIEYYVAPMEIQSYEKAEISSKTKWKKVKALKTADYKDKSVVVTSNTAIFYRYAEEKDVTKTPENEAKLASVVKIVKPS